MTIDQLRADAFTGCADTLRKLEDLINRQHQKIRHIQKTIDHIKLRPSLGRRLELQVAHAEQVLSDKKAVVHHVEPQSKKANRANSRLSTGPKTSIGKERSSLNSLKYGVSSGRFLPYSRNERLYKLLISRGFEENHALQSKRAFSSLQNAMATMAEAYLEVLEKDLNKIQSMHTDLLDVSAGSLLVTRKTKRYVRLSKVLSE